jgi:hypothetical protein
LVSPWFRGFADATLSPHDKHEQALLIHKYLYVDNAAIMTISDATNTQNKQHRLPISDNHHTLRLFSSYYGEEGELFSETRAEGGSWLQENTTA